MTDSFKARTTLDGGRAAVRDSESRCAQVAQCRPPALFAEDPAGESAALRRRRQRHQERHRGAAQVGPARRRRSHEIAFTPARVIMQDFTGVPCIVDLAAMREAIVKLGGDPQRVNPLAPAELVIDHSVQVDEYGAADSLKHNNEIEFSRNGERYMFLRWGQTAFSNFKVVPPNTGIVHQVNIERLARVIFADDVAGNRLAYPDTLVGTDSHTTMVNGLGVLGWGVGGIEAEAAMLGQAGDHADSAGHRLQAHRQPAGRHHGDRPRADGDRNSAQERRGRQIRGILRRRPARVCRSPTAPPSPTCRPSSARPARSFRSTRRPSAISSSPAARPSRSRWSRPMPRRRACGASTAHRPPTTPTSSSWTCRRSSPRSPVRSGRRTACRCAMPRACTERSVKKMAEERAQKNPRATGVATADVGGKAFEVQDGAVLIAAITSCTNTSNPAVLSPRACLPATRSRRGLNSKPWVKTSLAPGSRVVTDYLQKAGLLEDLEALGFLYGGLRLHHLHRQLRTLETRDFRSRQDGRCRRLLGAFGQPQFRRPRASGNQNEFPRLAAPGRRLCAGGKPGYRHHHRAAWGRARTASRYISRISGRAPRDVAAAVAASVDSAMFKKGYANVFAGDANWNAIKHAGRQDLLRGTSKSTYVKNPPYFDGMTMTPAPVERHQGRARAGACSAIRSPPITSRPPATSPNPVRPRST